jgi:tetratricopeptide (TPR) repeat protein
MSDIAASIRKKNSLDENFGIGAKVASLPSNRFGLRYRSCRDGRVFETVLGQRDGVYGRLVIEGFDDPVREVTAEYVATPHVLGQDWVEVVLLGNRANQDTVRDPYDQDPRVDPYWVEQALAQRFFQIPEGIELCLAPELTGQAVPVTFVPVGRTSDQCLRFERVRVNDAVSIEYRYYLENSGNAAFPIGAAGLVYKSEFYHVIDGANWVREAVGFGIPFAARHCAVLVELSSTYNVRADTYRQFLRYAEGSHSQVALRDFASVVRAYIPGWMRDLIASHAPQEVNFLGEIRRELQDLIEQLGIIAVPRDHVSLASQTSLPSSPPPTQEPTSPSPSAAKSFERPPEIIVLRSEEHIDERGLTARAACYIAPTHQLFINARYSSIRQMTNQMVEERSWETDMGEIEKAAEVMAEWAISFMVARLLIFTMRKSSLGWTAEEVSRAQSPECLTLVADNYALLMPIARRRLAEMIGEPLPEAQEDSHLNNVMRELRRTATELVEVRQAARAKIGTGPQAVPFLLRALDVELVQGNRSEALFWAEEALRIDPGHVWATRQYARLRQQAGDVAGARAALRSGLNATNSNPAILYDALSRLAMIERNYEEALDYARRTVECDPQNPWNSVHHAAVLDCLGKSEDAVAVLEAALAGPITSPQVIMRQLGQLAIRRADYGAALAWGERAQAESPSDPENVAFIGSVYEAQNKLEEAAVSFDAAARLAPQQPAPYLRYASRVALKRREFHAALAYAEEAVDYDGRSDSFHNLMVVHRAIGDMDGAERIYQQALASGKAQTCLLLREAADVASRRGDFESALDRCRQALALDPTDPWSYVTQADIFDRAKDLHAALAAATAGIQRAVDQLPCLNAACDLALRLGEIEKARNLVETMIARAPKVATGYLKLSLVQQKSDDLQAAETNAETAATLAGAKNPGVLRRRAELAQARGDLEGAIQFARDLTDAAPNEPWQPHYLSVLLEQAGNIDGARDAAAQAVAIAVGNTDVFEKRLAHLRWLATRHTVA